jgi:excisionase family DNA binding protein
VGLTAVSVSRFDPPLPLIEEILGRRRSNKNYRTALFDRVETSIMSDSHRKPPQPSHIDMEFEPLLDSTEAAALLQIHPKTLQKLARDGVVAGIRIGKLWRFRASALNEWLASMAG